MNATQFEIQKTMVLIEAEHTIDQDTIDAAVAALVKTVADYEASKNNETHVSHSESMALGSVAHQVCRFQEALACTRSRRCQWELEELWKWVVHTDGRVRETHDLVDDLWCVAEGVIIEPVLDGQPFNWGSIFPYPVITLLPDIVTFRSDSVIIFEEYILRRSTWAEAVTRYEAQLVDCQEFDTLLADRVDACDVLQTDLDVSSCVHFQHASHARTTFGTLWHTQMQEYEAAKSDGYLKQEDRKREFESLTIIDCLLGVIYDRVEDSVETGVPCITEENDPEGTARDIDTCHQVTTALTQHLTLDNRTAPNLPEFPIVGELTCSPAYIALEYSAFPVDAAIPYSTLDAYTEQLGEIINAAFVEDRMDHIVPPLVYSTLIDAYDTELQGGWPGCAAPLVCTTCESIAPDAHDDDLLTQSHECKTHEDYLTEGESDSHSFRCLDGKCIPYAARCNSHPNCDDESDELYCNNAYTGPAAIDKPQSCPALDPFEMNHLHQCLGADQSELCTSAASQCNNATNCGVGDASCDTLIPSVISTSGLMVSMAFRAVTSTSNLVFNDRDYYFTNHGSFGTSFIFVRTSNDDKNIGQDKVALIITSNRPVTFYVVTLGAVPVWLTDGQWTESSSLVAPTYGGPSHPSPHKAWTEDPLYTGDPFPDQVFNGVSPNLAQKVYHKTFPAGVVNLPGNAANDGSGNDGSYLLYLGLEPSS